MNTETSVYRYKESFLTQGGYIVVHHAEPDEKKDLVPLFFIPGWGASPESVSNFVLEVTNTGRTVFVLDHERLDSCENALLERYADVPCLEYNKAFGVQKILEKTAFEKIDICAHSEGAVAAIVAAHMHPKVIRNIILINPAGLLEKDSLLRLSFRFLSAIYHHIHYSKGRAHTLSVTLWLHVLWYVLWNPMQSLREAFRLPYCDIRNFLAEVLVHDDPRVSILLTREDRVFPYAQVAATLSHMPKVRVVALSGNHIQLYLQPQLFAKAIQEALSKQLH